jgi:hypothetical protein
MVSDGPMQTAIATWTCDQAGEQGACHHSLCGKVQGRAIQQIVCDVSATAVTLWLCTALAYCVPCSQEPRAGPVPRGAQVHH